MSHERRRSVMVVCDDHCLRGVLERILGDLGCDSTTVPDEVEAREILTIELPDLLITAGCGVPCATPETLPLIEFARAKNPELPVLVFSAEPTIQRAVEQVGCAFLLGPAHLPDLENKINECLFGGVRFGKRVRQVESSE